MRMSESEDSTARTAARPSTSSSYCRGGSHDQSHNWLIARVFLALDCTELVSDLLESETALFASTCLHISANLCTDMKTSHRPTV